MLIGNSLNSVSPLPSSQSEQLERPTQEQQARVPVQELMRQGEVRQVERLEALNRTENLSLRSKEAIQQYQKTEEAGRSFDGGELLGIDIYV